MKFSTREICLMSLFVVASAVLAQIVFPLPFSPVPISFGLIGTFISGIFLRPKCAFFTQICYLALGGAGMPVFGHFSGGLGILTGPTGGYLLAYPLMALIVSVAIENGEHMLAQKEDTKKPLLQGLVICSLSLSVLVCYALGTFWLAHLMKLPFSKALSLAVYPFIPLDALKIAFTTFAVLPLRERVLRTGIMSERAKQEV